MTSRPFLCLVIALALTGCGGAKNGGQGYPLFAKEGLTINFIMSTGQSLAIGGGAGNSDPPVISTSAIYPEYCLMFNTGVRGRGLGLLDPYALRSFLPLVEAYDGVNMGETPGAGMLNWLQHANNGADPQNVYLFRTHGASGRGYEDLKKGSIPYSNGLKEAARAAELARKLGSSARIQALLITHGERDFAAADGVYYEFLREWTRDYWTDFPPATGQAGVFPIFLDQLATKGTGEPSRVSIDQLRFALDTENVYLSCPKYQFDYVDHIHMNAEGYLYLGEYHAKALRALEQSGDWQPLHPVSSVLRGREIDILFRVPVPPLVLDTTGLPPAANYGFEYVDDTGSAGIESVELLNSTTVRITLTTAPTGANKLIRYAYTGTDTGTGPGAWGNLRDSDTTGSRHDPARNLYNWSVVFEESLY